MRSNGVLACWDDAGAGKELQAFDETVDYAYDVILGNVYDEIRSKLKRDELPFPEQCAHCFCLKAHLKADDSVLHKHVDTFQIEPSMGCQLDCLTCRPKSERKLRVRRTEHGHMTLDTRVLYKILDDLHRAGFQVDKFDFQGHGEPLLHKRVWDMCGYIAERFPTSIVSICTNANAKFERSMVHSGVNELMFAIDGVDQESYSPYRVHGDFDTAYKFMYEFSQSAEQECPHIDRVWKYVVFSHNDSDEQLLRAQEMGLKAKVTELRFMLTQLGYGSTRIFSLEDIPILDKNLNVTLSTYIISVQQLESALYLLKNAVWRLNASAAKNLSEFISHSLLRVLQTTPVIRPDYAKLIVKFRELLSSLPADEFSRFDILIAEIAARRSLMLTDAPMRWSKRASLPLAPPRASQLTVQECREVVANVEVDERWYLHTYQDVRLDVVNGKIANGAEHFRRWGYYEGRLPYRPYVDEEFYFQTYPDVLKSYEEGRISDAAEHFVINGYREGRMCSRSC